MHKDVVLNHIARISPMAKDYVVSHFDSADELLTAATGDGQGVFLKVLTDSSCIYYASFTDDASPVILNKVRQELARPVGPKETCFNVFGENRRIITLVQNSGFVLDMEGYVLEYDAPTQASLGYSELMVTGFDPAMSDRFIRLFERAYEKLSAENGWDPKIYTKTSRHFSIWLECLNRQKRVQSFWCGAVLVGCYTIDGNYIENLVVYPHFQNLGYGSHMLKHAIQFMREERGIQGIYLRVARSNCGARRLFERIGFRVVSQFAEHTYNISMKGVCDANESRCSGYTLL